jgi:predicted nucleotidyltransferase
MNKILEIKFGSHLYGTNTENSDLDFKGIYLPTAREIVLGQVKKTIASSRPKAVNERNNKDDVDIEIVSLDRFVDLLLQGQTMALDMLFSGPDHWTHYTNQGASLMFNLHAHRHLILNRNVNAFVGYARQQAAKYGVKGFRVAAMREILEYLAQMPKDHEKLLKATHDLSAKGIFLPKNEFTALVECKGKNGPELHIEVCNRKVPLHATVVYAKKVYQRIFDEYGQRALKAEKNEGVDWKALSHAVRVNAEAIELLTTKFITFPRPERELLLKIKLGQMDYNDVAEIITKGLEDLQAAQAVSTLPDKPDRKWAEDFVCGIYTKIVKDG